MSTLPAARERGRSAAVGGDHLVQPRLQALVALAILVAPACRSTAEPTASTGLPVPATAQPAPTAAPEAREAARSVELLSRLIEVDRQAVEIAERHLVGLRELARAGRASDADVKAAELEVLQLRSRLQGHEREQAEAERSLAAARGQ